MRPVVMAALLAVALGGCVTTGGSPGGAFCETARPQRPSRAEISAMTPVRQREVLAHNEFGAKACGWRP